MAIIAELTMKDTHLRGKYFSYDGCETYPVDPDSEDAEKELMRLAADVLLDILEDKGDSAQ